MSTGSGSQQDPRTLKSTLGSLMLQLQFLITAQGKDKGVVPIEFKPRFL